MMPIRLEAVRFSASALVVERRCLHTSVPALDFGVVHHVVKRLQALHDPEDAEDRLRRGED